MIRHWNRHLKTETDPKARARMMRSRVINAAGAFMSATVLLVVLITKFQAGARYAIAAMLVLFVLMLGIRRHYARVAEELQLADDEAPMLPSRVHAIVLLSKLHKPAMRAVAYARATRPTFLEAVTVDVDPEETEALRAEWTRREIPVPLKVLSSPYREITRPIVEYVRSIRSGNPRDVVVVYIPEYVLGRWYEQVLHNQSALRLKARLLFTPGVMVASVPWQLRSSRGPGGRVLRRSGRRLGPAGSPLTSLVGTEAVVEVGPVAHGGHCVARLEGRVVFVRHALPGERVRVRVTEGDDTSRFLRGDAVEVLDASEHRVTPPCPYAGPGRCGGCDFQHASLPYQRRLKADVVARAARPGWPSSTSTCQVEPLPGDDGGLQLAHPGRARRRRRRPGRAARPPLARCHRHRRLPHRRPAGRRSRARSTPCGPGAPASTSSRPTSRAARCSSRCPTGATAGRAARPGGGVERRLPAARPRVLAGAPRRGRGLRRARPRRRSTLSRGRRSSTCMPESGSSPSRSRTRWVRRGRCSPSRGTAPAVVDGMANSAGRPWVEWRHGRVDRVLAPIVRRGITADLVVLDPPRTGAGRDVSRQVAALRPRLLAYVACDPAALARDTAYLAGRGLPAQLAAGLRRLPDDPPRRVHRRLRPRLTAHG